MPKPFNRIHPERSANQPAVYKVHWSYKYIAIFGSLCFLVLIDVGSRIVGMTPPEDPIVSHVRTYMHDFTPFVEHANGMITIRPDWVKRDEMYRFTKGTRAGRLFLLPGFRPTQFSRHKTPETLRIFALGGSTTFGQWVGPGKAFPNILEGQLQKIFEHRKVEVINLGCPGLESTRVAILFKRVLALDPDLVVIYSGHNEMLMGERLSRPAVSLVNTFRAQLLRLSTIAAWFNYGFSTYFKPQNYEIVSEEIKALKEGKILPYLQMPPDKHYEPLSQKYLKKVREDYLSNIRSIAVAAKESGIPTIFALPVPNLQYAPEQSAHSRNFKQKKRFAALFGQVVDAVRKGQLKAALMYADKAIGISPGYAMTHYLRGSILLKTGQTSKAIEALQQAVDMNVYAHRVTSTLQSAMIEMVKANDVPWVDLRPEFQGENSFSPDRKLFVDHCHPNDKGHLLIAKLLFPRIQAELLKQHCNRSLD